MAAASTAGTLEQNDRAQGIGPDHKVGHDAARNRDRHRQSDRQPYDGENGALVQHHARDTGGRGADGKPDSDLARPPAHGVGHDSV